ncbi:MAG: hypothetical protein IIA64_10615 [Planctomycetes bacterium]|nr:hypothetical protein [Planctomycetota bacterium]
MTAARDRLPNRRDNHVETLTVGGLEFTATVGFDPATDQPRELFLDGGKGGSGFAALLADVATTISVAIQYGVPITALAKSVGRAPNVGTTPGSFEQLGAVRVQFKTDARNERSQRAIERLGAVKEGVLRKSHTTHNGYIRDSVYYSIIDDEWPAVKQRLDGFLSREGKRSPLARG